MRRNANREERGGRLLSALAAAVLLTLLLGIIHRLYHCEYTDTDTPNDCFAVSAATGETALRYGHSSFPAGKMGLPDL